jgi:hypothetical protein
MNTLSVRFYRCLLWLYPSHFVNELGDSLVQTFRDMLRDAFQKRGYLGIALLWFRIVPDFVYSAFELLTSTAGDYLRWYFRLRWILACALGIGTGAMVAMALRSAGFFDYFGLNPRWGLAGLPLWLALGFFQSQVLTTRYCYRMRWVFLTTLGGVLGILGAQLLTSAFSLVGLGLFSPYRWQTWALQPLVMFVPLVGVAIGLCQKFAFRQKDVRAFQWTIAWASAAYISGLLSIPVSLVLSFAFRIGVGDVMANLLQNAAAGAFLGLVTAGQIKWILWNQPEQPGTPVESLSKENSADV